MKYLIKDKIGAKRTKNQRKVGTLAAKSRDGMLLEKRLSHIMRYFLEVLINMHRFYCSIGHTCKKKIHILFLVSYESF